MKELTLTINGDILKFSLTGEIDILNSGELYYEIESLFLQDRKDVFLDFTGVTFIDSTGLGTIVKINNMIKNSGKKLVLMHMSDHIKKIFTICSLDSILDIQS